MRKVIPLGLSAALAVGVAVQSAHAWSTTTCQGNVQGMRTSRTFTIDRCNVAAGGARDQVITHGFGMWNRIPGVAHRFNTANGDSDCVLETDDWVGFRERSQIDGANAHISYHQQPCRWPHNQNSDGRRIDIKISIATDLATGAGSEQEVGQNARGAFLHEMGHALGGEHVTSEPNMLYNPDWGSLRVGSRSVTGALANRTEVFVGDDAEFGRIYHGDGSATQADYAASAQGFSGDTFNLNGGSQFVCPGQVVSFDFTYANIGTASNGSTPVWLDIVLSTNSTISTADTFVSGWDVFPGVDAFFTHNDSITIPSASAGTTFFLGAIIDPNQAFSEIDESNNAVFLNRTYFVASGC